MSEEHTLPTGNIRGIDVTSLDPVVREVLEQLNRDHFELLKLFIDQRDWLKSIQWLLDEVAVPFESWSTVRRDDAADDE